MATRLETDKFLRPIENDQPCGVNLSYDPLYLQLEDQAAGVPEQQVGDTVVAAQEPNWREIHDLCLSLFERTKDLRVATYLTLSELCLNGLMGFRDGLSLLTGLVKEFWPTVWPQLDPDDKYDPMERVNILSSLSPPAGAYQDPMMFLQRLRETPLCESRAMGKFSLRDILIATGELEPIDQGEQLEISLISAAFTDTPLERLQELADAVDESLSLLAALDQTLDEKLNGAIGPDFSLLQRELQQMQTHYNQHLHGDSSNEDSTSLAADDTTMVAAEGNPVAVSTAISGDIRSRADVLKTLDRICQYYQQAEPSSPVPFLLKRARGLVTKNFVDILRDLSPEALDQTQVVLGRATEAESEEE